MRCARPRLMSRHSSPLSTRGTRSRGNGRSFELPPTPPPPLVSNVMPCCIKIASRRRPASISPSGPSRLSSSTSARAVGRGVPSASNSSSRNGARGRYASAGGVCTPELTSEFSRARCAIAFDGWRNRCSCRCSPVTVVWTRSRCVCASSTGPTAVLAEVLAGSFLAVAFAIPGHADAVQPVHEIDRQAGADDARAALQIGFAAERHDHDAAERHHRGQRVANARQQPRGRPRLAWVGHLSYSLGRSTLEQRLSCRLQLRGLLLFLRQLLRATARRALCPA